MTGEIAPSPRRSLRRPSMIVGLVLVVVLAALVVVPLLWGGGDDPVLDAGAGPPASDITPPFEDAAAVGESMVLTGDDPCQLLDAEQVASVVGPDAAPEPTESGCRYASADGMVELVVEAVDEPSYSVLSVESEAFPDAPVVIQTPWLGLVFVDAERSVMVVDAGARTMVLRLRDASLDPTEHRERLVSLLPTEV